MSSLQRISGGRLGLPCLHLKPIVRSLLVQGNARQSRAQLPKSVVLLSSYLQIPRIGRPGHRYYSEYSRPPPRDNGKLFIGSIIVSCTAVWLWHWYTVGQNLQKQQYSLSTAEAIRNFEKHFVLSQTNIREGRYYTILTSTFTHISFTHLLVNMASLWGIGQIFITLYGVPKFALVWIGSGVLGGALQLAYWDRYSLSRRDKAVGASGSVFGLLSALSFAVPQTRMIVAFVPMTLRMTMVLSVVVTLAAIKEGWLPWMGHADHLGGMAFGAIWWAVAGRRGRGRVRFIR